MCLWVDLDDQKEFKKDHRGKSITAYKVVMYMRNYNSPSWTNESDIRTAPWGLKSINFDFWWTPGVKKAKTAKKHKRLWDGKEVNKGIHVFLTRDEAEKYTGEWDSLLRQIIIPVKCKIKDLIAVGRKQQAVFTQVVFSKSAHQRALKKGEQESKRMGF